MGLEIYTVVPCVVLGMVVGGWLGWLGWFVGVVAVVASCGVGDVHGGAVHNVSSWWLKGG